MLIQLEDAFKKYRPKSKAIPLQGLDRPRGFQDNEIPDFKTIGT
jgi:hypothetical protein